MSLFHLWSIATSVFLLSLLGTALVRTLAKSRGWIAFPREDRWHRSPVALHGGVGFYPAFSLGAGAVLIMGRFEEGGGLADFLLASKEGHLVSALLAGSFLMFCFGLWDSVKRFKPATKLLCELAAASLFILAGGMFPLTDIPVVNVLVTYFWFIGITNAVNMLDNMDGLSSGVVMVASVTLILLAAGVSDFSTTGNLAVPLGIIFVASLLGFWVHNRPPASIFMGDSGSLFMGYVLAGLAVPSPVNGFMGIKTGNALGPILALMIPATVLAIPIFDTTLVTITRKWRAQRATHGGIDHSSHRLVGLGLSEKKTVWVLYGMAALGGLIALQVQRFPEQSLPVLGFFVLALVLCGVYLGGVKIQSTEATLMPSAWIPLVTNLLYKRRAAEVLLDTVLIATCFYGAYLLRFEGHLSPATTAAMVRGLPIVVSCSLLAFFLAGIYRGQWRLISVNDVPSYAGGVLGGATTSLAVVALFTRFEGVDSRSVYIIFGVLMYLAMLGTRLSFRLLDAVLSKQVSNGKARDCKPVLIYGAGKAGKLLYEEMMFHLDMREFVPVGFLDDDPNLEGRKLCGVPVRGPSEWLRERRGDAPEIWVSSRQIPDQKAEDYARLWNTSVVVRRLRLHMELLTEETTRHSAKEERQTESFTWIANPGLIQSSPDNTEVFVPLRRANATGMDVEQIADVSAVGQPGFEVSSQKASRKPESSSGAVR